MKCFDNRTEIITVGTRGMARHLPAFVAERATVVIADVLDQEWRTLGVRIHTSRGRRASYEI